mmetsp:Transcript_6955/g.23067  ORF Transcript_6955/g.23067 Transcript_6955/m.23067 type:complete len:209 (+) Transcript_6955:2157-2783(+)
MRLRGVGMCRCIELVAVSRNSALARSKGCAFAICLFGAISRIGAVTTSKYAINKTSRHLRNVKILKLSSLFSFSFFVAFARKPRYAYVKGTAIKIKYVLDTGTATSRNFVKRLFTFFEDARSFTPSLPGANMFTVHIMKNRSERCVAIIAIECCNTGKAFALFFSSVRAASPSLPLSSSFSSTVFTTFLSPPAKLAIDNTIVKRLKYA